MEEDSSLMEYNKTIVEWGAVEAITAGCRDRNDDDNEDSETISDPHSLPSPLINYSEIVECFTEQDFSQYKNAMHCTVERSLFRRIQRVILGPPHLLTSLHEEREKLFLMALCPLDSANRTHDQILQTIHRILLQRKFDCPRFGNHWEEIGFQGTDPGTDLRGTGCLGLINLLYLLTTSHYLPIARDIFFLSVHESQNFPFCVMSINMTRISLQLMREELYNKECNSTGQFITVQCQVYVALYLKLYQIWKTERKTIADSGFVLKRIEEDARCKPRSLLRVLTQYKEGKGITASSEKKGKGPEEFIGICDLASGDKE